MAVPEEPQSASIRPAGPSDDAPLAALFAAYGAEYADSLGDQDLAGEGSRARAYYASGAVLVAEAAGEVVGCVAYEPWDAPRCRMKRMIVAPAHRGKGVGRKLAVAILEAAKAAGFTQMCLDTTPPMAAARALYRDLGFTTYEPDYTAPCVDTVYMRRSL